MTPTAWPRTIPFLFAFLLVTACRGPSPNSTGSADDARSYPASGVIENISPDRHIVTIHHHDIPGYMMEMTMDFPVKSTNELNGLAAGYQITFTLVVHENDDWIENIQRVKQAYVAFGCGSIEQIVVIPADKFSTWCDDLPPYTQGQTGWHVHLRRVTGKLELRREGRGEPPIDVTNFVI